MKNKSLLLAFLAGMACVFSLHLAETTFQDKSHENIMRKYCSEKKLNLEACGKYVN